MKNINNYSNIAKIPKKIHYCWFGKSEKPKAIIKCIENWKKILNDYEFYEWNEDNFNIEMNDYVKEAYSVKKYAFVSDYVRVYELNKYGGIYLDTDVEVIKKFDDLLDNELLLGFEFENYVATSMIASNKGSKFLNHYLEQYSGKHFIKDDGAYNLTTNVTMITELLQDYGLKKNNTYQIIDYMNEKISIYPKEYFSPFDYSNYIDYTNEDTYCIHHFDSSWSNEKIRAMKKIKKYFSKVFGGDSIKVIKNIVQR